MVDRFQLPSGPSLGRHGRPYVYLVTTFTKREPQEKSAMRLLKPVKLKVVL